MSIPIDSEPYFDIDVVIENIDEVGNAKIKSQLQNWGDEVDREIDTKLFYLFSTFPLTSSIVITDGFTESDFRKIKQLANERLEAKYWLKTNSDKTLMDQSNENLENFKESLTQIPAETE